MSTNFAMLSVQNSCDFVIGSVRDSFLNYSIQETPFSLYLTIRKSFSKVNSNSNQISFGLQQKKVHEEQVQDHESLRIKLKSVENSNRILQQNYEEATNNSEESYKEIKQLETKLKCYEKIVADVQKKDKIIEQLKKDKMTLESELEAAEKNWKNANKVIKTKEKEIHDIQKENFQVTENLVKVKTDLNNLTVKVNKEKKEEEKKQRKKEKKDFLY